MTETVESPLSELSLWDFLVEKTVSKRLGTAESLLSLFAEMQVARMELKNLAEQSLASEKPEADSVSVTLSPIMSSVLGMSQAGGVTRYVLPQSQIPQHYHELLSLPASTIQPQQENSLSLEENLGSRQDLVEVEEEETLSFES